MKSFPTVALVALLCAAPAVAHAQDDDAEVTRMAKEHYKAGLDAYKNGKYDVAIKELKKAYLLKRLPALLLNIGATYRKMGDLDLALHFYKKYLDEAPPEARDRGEVEQTIKEIQTEKEGGGAKPPEEAQTPKEEAPPPRPKEESAPPAKEWSHVVVDAAPPDSPLDVRVSTPVMKGVKVYLFYRGAGEENFNAVLMKRRGPEKVGRIPAKAMQGKAIQYYIEAKDPAGTVVKSAGSQASPNVIMIDPSAPVQLVSTSEERREREEQPEAAPQEEERAKPRRSAGDDEEAPMMGHVGEPSRRETRKSGGGAKMGPLMIAGIALTVGGVAGIGVGIAGFAIANQKANALTADAMHDPGAPGPIDGAGNKIFFNNDPNAGSQQEADLQSQGKLWNTVGIAMTVTGGVLAVAGIACIIADRVMVNGGGSDKPKKKRKRRVSEEEEASIQRFFVAPSAGVKYAGVGAGFSF